MNKRNERGYWINRKGRERFEDTRPERALDELAEYMGLELVKPAPTRVWKDGNLYLLQPDRKIMLTNINLHVDGHPSHFTKRGIQKDDWKDTALLMKGYRNLRIPAELLLKKEHWAYVGWCIRCFMNSEEPTNYRIEA